MKKKVVEGDDGNETAHVPLLGRKFSTVQRFFQPMSGRCFCRHSARRRKLGWHTAMKSHDPLQLVVRCWRGSWEGHADANFHESYEHPLLGFLPRHSRPSEPER